MCILVKEKIKEERGNRDLNVRSSKYSHPIKKVQKDVTQKARMLELFENEDLFTQI